MTTLDEARQMSLGAQLARHARRTPGTVAFKFGDASRSYGEADERVSRLANALAGRGVGRGERVGILMANRIETVEAMLGAVRLGAIAVPINFRLTAPEIAYILGNCGARVLVADAALAAQAAEARAGADAPADLIVVGDEAEAAPYGDPFEAVLAAADPAPPGIIVPETDAALIMYTSGTTGRPKGAVLSHYNLNMNTVNMFTALEVHETDQRWLAALPLFHIAGVNGIAPFLWRGNTSIILPSGQFDALEAVEILEREQVTSCYFVPTQWQAICAVPGVRERRFALQRVSWGASIAPPSVLKALAETFPGVRAYDVFGQTEMSSVTCVHRADRDVGRKGSVGRPVPTVEVAVVDDDVRPVPRGEVGEIVYRGPTVLQGYWNNPEATAEAFRGGWFHSGDLVREDEDGFFYVVDRKKDMIISGGENIYSPEVEAAIDQHPGVREVAVIGVPHPKWVETPVAVVAPRDPDAPPAEEEIIEWCRTRIASYKKPTRVVFVEALPRNASGKVLKTALRKMDGVAPKA